MLNLSLVDEVHNTLGSDNYPPTEKQIELLLVYGESTRPLPKTRSEATKIIDSIISSWRDSNHYDDEDFDYDWATMS